MNLKLANNKDSNLWNEFVEKSSGSIFHRFSWLKIASKNTNTKLWPLMGFKGKELIFVLPLFHSRKWYIDIFTSPPPGGIMPYLGPLVSIKSTRQSQIESMNKEIVKSVDNFIIERLGKKPNIMKMQFGGHDVRTFLWNGYDVIPTYNYEIKIGANLNDIVKSFSKSERHKLRKIKEDKTIKIVNGNLKELLIINNLVRKRYEQQNIRYDISNNYLMEIYNHYKHKIEIIALKRNNQIVNGIVLFRSAKNIGHWIGAINRGSETGGEVTLLHYESIKLSKLKGLKVYDLCGANTLHLCEYKSKLNPSIKLRFNITKQDVVGFLVNRIYRKIKNI